MNLINHHSIFNRAEFAWHAAIFDSEIASVRIRCMQVMEELSILGTKVERFTHEHISHYRAVVFSKAYRDVDIDIANQLKKNKVRVVLDLCDNHIYSEESDDAIKRRAVRLESMANLSDAIVCATPVLANQISTRWPKFEKKITVIPDMLDKFIFVSEMQNMLARFLDKFHLNRLSNFHRNNKEALNLIWFGNHGVAHAKSGMAEILQKKLLLEEINLTTPITLTVISNSHRKYGVIFKNWALPTLYMPWRIGAFDCALRHHHVALMPISINPFTLAKTINRPATAIMAGLGVIADSIPSYEELRPYVWLDDWRNGLLSYATSFEYESNKVELAKDFLLKKYSGSTVAQQWKDLLSSP